MAKVFDTTQDCSSNATALRQLGFEAVVRYYCVDALKWKRIRPAEAQAISTAGLKLCVVYQDRQNQTGDFTLAKGRMAGTQAYTYAQTAIMQPEGSAIYFSADYDPSADEIQNSIIPFFQGVRDTMAGAHGGTMPYRIGIYGSGRTCRMLLDASLAELAWLAQSKGFGEYDSFVKSGLWALSQQMPTTVSEIAGDPDDLNPAVQDYGGFSLNADHFGPALPGTAKLSVNAGNGLRVRSGPGPDFDQVAVLSNGQLVTALAETNGWLQVDTNGDGSPEGYCLASFLKAI